LLIEIEIGDVYLRMYLVLRAIWVLLVSSQIWAVGSDSKDMIPAPTMAPLHTRPRVTFSLSLIRV
jgi:hypothetical protein